MQRRHLRQNPLRERTATYRETEASNSPWALFQIARGHCMLEGVSKEAQQQLNVDVNVTPGPQGQQWPEGTGQSLALRALSLTL